MLNNLKLLEMREVIRLQHEALQSLYDDEKQVLLPENENKVYVAILAYEKLFKD